MRDSDHKAIKCAHCGDLLKGSKTKCDSCHWSADDKDGGSRVYLCDFSLLGNRCNEVATLGIPKFHGSSKGRSSSEYRFSCDKHRYNYVEKDWRDELLAERMEQDNQRLIEKFGEEKVAQMSGYEKMAALLGSLGRSFSKINKYN